MSEERGKPRRHRVERVERRLAVPVLIAAAVSVPSVFLMRAGGWMAVLGKVLSWASAGLLTGEPILLFLLTGDRLAWLRTHVWPILIALVAVPAVLFTVAPLQVLRLLRLVHVLTALRVLRVNKILGAADAIRQRLRLGIFWGRVITFAAVAVAVGFVVVVLTNPDTRTHRLIQDEAERFGVVPVVIVIALAGTAVVLGLRYAMHWAVGQLRERLSGSFGDTEETTGSDGAAEPADRTEPAGSESGRARVEP